MRGWPLLFAAALLAFVPSAQALSPTDVVRLRLPADWEGAADTADEVCVDVSSLWDDPTAIVVIAAQCTFGASVSVQRDEHGNLVVTIVLLGQTVAKCSLTVLGPDGSPDFHVGPFYGPDLVDRHPVCMN